MKNIKEPKFEKNEDSIFFVKDILSNDDSIDIGMTAFVKYQGTTTIIKIEDKISEDEFIGLITGFLPPPEICKDLSMHDRVKIMRENIIGITK